MAYQSETPIARFFTRARRIPMLLGKLPGGGKIPGGPYTLPQLSFGVVVFVVGWWTKPIWGPPIGAPLIQTAALLLVCAGVVFMSGKIPTTRRKLSDLALSALTAVHAPATGRYDGSAVRLAAPHQVTGTTAICFDDDELAAAARTVPVAVTAPKRAKPAKRPHPTVTPAPAAPELAPATSVPAAAVLTVPDPQDLPENVIPLRPRRARTGLEHLLEQAQNKESK